MRQLLEKVLSGGDLSQDESRQVCSVLMAGTAAPSQVGALLAALRMKGESPEEIVGFVRAMRQHAVPVDLPARPVIDTCGTGGDGSGSFNISTLAALVVAGCGQPVAKHGNRAASSRCGSADFLEALGIRVDLEPRAVGRSVEETGFAFLMAPLYHPATRRVAAIRRELKIETIFNIIGPLSNPASPEFQLVGVSSPERARKMAEALRLLGTSRAFVVHNELGWDELTPCGRNLVIEVNRGRIGEFTVGAEDAGLSPCRADQLRGGAPEENARIGLSILRGERGPQRDTIVLNAGMSLWLAGRASGLGEGAKLSAACIDAGRAASIVEKLRRLFPRDGSGA